MQSDREKAGAHPGWAVKSKDGHWLTTGHGYHLMNAACASVKSSEEEAKRFAEDAQEDFQGGFEYDIVVAWEPVCEKLRNDIHFLKQANTITPEVVFDLTMDLESILYRLKGKE